MPNAKDGFVALANDNRDGWRHPKLSKVTAAQFLNAHRHKLTLDIASIIFAQLSGESDDMQIPNYFVRKLIEYREDCALKPTHLDATPILRKIVENIPMMTKVEFMDSCFYRLNEKASELPFLKTDTANDMGNICAANTSQALKRFLKWQKALAGQRALSVEDMSVETLENSVNHMARNYVDHHADITIANLGEDMMCAVQRAKDRSKIKQVQGWKEGPIIRLFPG